MLACAAMAEVARLLVDARPVNHPTARDRGIGRYTTGLLDGLSQIDAPVIALYDTDVEAGLLHEAVPTLELRRWSPATIREFTAPDTWYLATQLMLHPLPLDPVPRIITDSGLPVAAVMYDVIPERYPDLYQTRPQARAQVQLRGMLTRTLDALLAISDFAADTAAAELRFPRARIATIGAGAERRFAPATGDPWPRVSRLLESDGRALVLMVSGTDSRKNTQRMIRAWGLVAAAVRATNRLVVVGAVDPTLLQQWHGWAHEAGVYDDVAFIGGVSDDQMVALHQLAALAVMPSLEEGFGLPVLEAAACGCPVITSNTSSLPEVLACPAAEFDPFDTASIATAVEQAITKPAHRATLQAAARLAAERWTWANTAHATLAALEALEPRQQRVLKPVPRRIALQGRFDESPAGLTNTAFADEIRALPEAAEVHLLVEHESLATATHAEVGRFPSLALGRFVHPSLFDEVIQLHDDMDRSGVLAGLAGDVTG